MDDPARRKSAQQKRSTFQRSGGSRGHSWAHSTSLNLDGLLIDASEICLEDERHVLPGVPIRAASVPALVRLTLHAFQDNGRVKDELQCFPRVFFLMHRWFIASSELAGLLLLHFDTASSLVPCTQPAACQAKPKKCRTEKYRDSVVHALHFWITSFPLHFELDAGLREAVEEFSRKMSGAGEMGRARAAAVDLSALPSYDWVRNVSLKDTEAGRPARKVSLLFNHLEPDELAHHLTFLEHKIMRRITFEDFKRYAENGTLSDNPKLERSVSLFNGLSQWIQCVVLSRPTPQQRADVIVKFVRVAKNLRSLQNFNSLMGVVGSLSHSALARLSKTMDSVPLDDRKILADLTRLVSSTANFSCYRKALQNSRGFKIPILAVHLKDLISLNTALPDTVENGLVYFKKVTQLSLIFQELEELQQSSPPAHANMDLLNTLKISLDLAYSEDEIYELSLAREPKTSTSTTSSPARSPVVEAGGSYERQVQTTVDAVFKSYDSNHDGFISRDEFQAILTNFPSIDAFFVLDENRDGMISKVEMEKYLKKNAGSRHNFHETTYFKPTFCIHCSGLLWGLIKQGFKCRNCGVNAHKHCIDYMLHECKTGQLLFLSSPEPQAKRRGFRRRKKSNSHSETGSPPHSPKFFNSLEALSLSVESNDSGSGANGSGQSLDPGPSYSHFGVQTPKGSRRFSVLTSGRPSLSVPSSPKLGLASLAIPLWSPCRSLFHFHSFGHSTDKPADKHETVAPLSPAQVKESPSSSPRRKLTLPTSGSGNLEDSSTRQTSGVR